MVKTVKRRGINDIQIKQNKWNGSKEDKIQNQVLSKNKFVKILMKI